MSLLEPLLAPEICLCNVEATSRKRVLQIIAQNLAREGLDEDAIFDSLMARERLGSTGLGDGVAIPHCRLPTPAIRVGLFTTSAPVNYDAADGEPVDIFFVIVVPTEERELHLKALAEISTILANDDNRRSLRECVTSDELHNTLVTLIESAQST